MELLYTISSGTCYFLSWSSSLEDLMCVLTSSNCYRRGWRKGTIYSAEINDCWSLQPHNSEAGSSVTNQVKHLILDGTRLFYTFVHGPVLSPGCPKTSNLYTLLNREPPVIGMFLLDCIWGWEVSLNISTSYKRSTTLSIFQSFRFLLKHIYIKPLRSPRVWHSGEALQGCCIWKIKPGK